MVRKSTIGFAAVAILMTAWFLPAASAACLEQEVFCSDRYVFSRPLLHNKTCKELWKLRNSILNERGYCFPRKIEAVEFDNNDCTLDNYEKIPLNLFERDNVALILDVERAKFCH